MCRAIRFTENLAAQTVGHGIRVFPIHSGTVRTAMLEAAAESPECRKWLEGFFRQSLAAGHDVPAESAATLEIFLALGQAEALSGCHISVGDDVAELARRAQ